jgi:hypothetical protein
LEEYKKAPTIGEQINQWFAMNPNYNIGVFSGKVSNNIVVVDVDWQAAVERLNEKQPYHTCLQASPTL